MYDEQSYTEYQLKKRSRMRQIIREIYLNVTLRLLKGRTIDFGCGTGELLRKLPQGSLGLEVNQTTIEYCKEEGLNVRYYDPLKDKYMLSDFAHGEFESLVISHVLEHIKNPAQALLSLLKAARRLDIKRVVVIVPGKRGFAFDSTHQTYIGLGFFEKNELKYVEGFGITMQRYFPINLSIIGLFFTYLELQVVYDRKTH